tara:strand:- start:131 stop:1084 length:954 start_codon:yes stop_codon:yes gene_type:complete
MGMMQSPERCHITGLPTTDFPSSEDICEYFIEIDKNKFLLKFNWDHKNNSFVESNKYILYGLLLNGKFPNKYIGASGEILNNSKLEKLIQEAVVPKSPDEKKDNLLIYLHSLQEYEGSPIRFSSENEIAARKLYFKNYKELVFFIYTLQDQGLIGFKGTKTSDSTHISQINLTYEGLTKVIELAESGNKSKRCFIAMSFSPEATEIRDAIKKVIYELGFVPILIDEIHYDSHITINDALIAEIKKCKFMVADFTEHKYGVYFEAGYALGLKRPVIYTCKNDDFGKTHFDTNHYPHIIYANTDELKEKLKNKIEAWII